MTTQFDYSGKVAFVSGGGTGIGRATALAFAKAGANVAVVGRDQGGLAETVRLGEGLPGRLVAIGCDVSTESAVETAVQRTVEAFGRLDFAFNNAGIDQKRAALADVPTDQWNALVGINLTGIYNAMKYQIPEMLKAGGGSIVNTSSGAGVKGFPEQAAYCATKFGVIGLSKGTALDYAAQNIRVNVVSPGIIDTEMMKRAFGDSEADRQKVADQEPVGRPGKPEEIAGTVLWLCSDLAAFTTGSNVVVDGGQTV